MEPIAPAVSDVMAQVRAIADQAAGQAPQDPYREQASQEGAALLAHFENVLAQVCGRAGMHRREVLADLALVPPGLMGAVGASGHGPRVGDLVAGRLHLGFGLAGSAGVGKTMALAAWFKAGLAVRLRERISQLGKRGLAPGFAWRHWPAVVDHLRRVSVRDGGLDDAHGELERLESAQGLVLDDLGAERLKGSYGEDWVANQLDLLIDGRHGAMRPTWYTTNLTRDEFVRRYGARLYSRLCAENPMVELAPARDLRFAAGASPATREPKPGGTPE